MSDPRTISVLISEQVWSYQSGQPYYLINSYWPESDHCLALSLTHSLTYSCFVDLVDMTLADKDEYVSGVMKSIAEWQLTARQPTAWQQHFYSLKKYCICLVDSWYIRPFEGGELKTVCSNTVCWSSLTFYVAYSWILLLVYKLETDSVHILFNYQTLY